MRLKTLILSALAGAAATAALAASAAAQSERDAEFARVLMERGYTDLAEDEVRRIEGAPGYPTEVRGDAGYLLVRILKAKAAGSSGDRAQELLGEVATLIDELAKRYPSHSQSQVADLEKLQARLTEADSLLAAAKDEEDETKAAAKNAQAVSLYKDVLDEFDAVIEEINQALAKSGSEDLEFKRDLSEYLRASAYLSYGTALTALGADADRSAALETAYQQFQSFFDQRGTFFNLWTLSYIGQGQALVELGRYDEAMELLALVRDIEPPGHPDPDVDRQQREFVQDLRARGTYWMLAACARGNNHQRGIEAFERYRDATPGYLDTHFGKLCVFEYAKALAGLGRLRAAGDAIDEVLQRSMQGDVIPGFDIDRYGVSACKALADIAESASGFFPAPLQYRAGQGFFFKGEWEKATWALKGVIAAGASDDERQLWGGKALLDLGAAYQKLGRLYEAAIAYQGLYRMFPDSEHAGTAMKHAKQMFDVLAKEDAWYRELADEVIRDQQELLTGISAEKSKYGQAVAWQSQGRFVPAAQKFLEIQPQVEDRQGQPRAVAFYGEALANAGYCYYLAAQQAGAGPAGAQYRKQALETLDRALAYGRENEQPSAWAAAAYFKSLIAGSEAEGRWEEALKALEAFDGPLKGEQSYLARAYGQQVTCLVKLGRLAEAEERVEKLVERHESSTELVSAALQLGSALVEAASASEETDPGLLKKAGRYVALWVERSPRASFNGAAWAGDVLFRAGMFDKAAQAFDKAFEKAPTRDALDEAERAAMVFEATRTRQARALRQIGQVDKAAALLEEVKKGYEAAGQDPLQDLQFAFAYSNALYDQWAQSKDERLVLPLKAAHEAYWRIVGQIEGADWEAFVRSYNLPRVPYFRAKLEADARKLEIDLAMKSWGPVKFAVDQLERQGYLDDQIDLADGSWVGGRITEDHPDGGVTIVDRGEQRKLLGSEIKRIDRFPKDLRKRFFELRERAIREGGLQ